VEKVKQYIFEIKPT